MQQKDKVIGILIVLCCAMNVSAWESEVNIVENESCDFNILPIFNESTLTNPYWFDLNKHVHSAGDPLISPALRSNDQTTFCITYQICKYLYDSSTSSYVQSTCCIEIDDCITTVYKVDAGGTGYYALPDDLMTTQIDDAKLVQKYYQDMINAGHIDCAEFTNLDESSDGTGDYDLYPDVFGINVTVNVGNTELNEEYNGYLMLNGDAENELMSGQDHGFDMEGISSEGGSGDIANVIGWGKMDETSRGHMSSFNVFFYTLIPIIFILLVMKILGKVSD